MYNTVCMSVCAFPASKQHRAKAKFSYHPQADNALQLANGVEVIVLNVVEEGW